MHNANSNVFVLHLSIFVHSKQLLSCVVTLVRLMEIKVLLLGNQF